MTIDPEYFALAQDVTWRLTTQPGAKHDEGSIETAVDIGFAVASIFFVRRDEERKRLEAIERDLLRDQLAHELATNSAKPNDQKAQKRRRPMA